MAGSNKADLVNVKVIRGKVVMSMSAEAADAIGHHLVDTCLQWGGLSRDHSLRPQDPVNAAVCDLGEMLQNRAARLKAAEPARPQHAAKPSKANKLTS